MSMNHKAETNKAEVTTRFARIIDGRDRSTEVERQEAFEAARAEGISTFNSIRAHILLGVADGNAQLVKMWLEEIEFGDFNDNHEAFIVSQGYVVSGKIEEGLVVLHLLREHIVRSGEVKSVRHLLPEVNKAIISTEAGMTNRERSFAACGEAEILQEGNGLPLFM